jgi:PhzF family phenazine biosynthesis protein
MLPLRIVDAFTAEPFAGNPAAVCFLDTVRDDAWMQSVAAEMNLSETAFLLPVTPDDTWSLRWFTPSIEIDLCGHATLASAHALWETGQLSPHARARFATRSGELFAVQAGDRIELDFPATVVEPAEAPAGLLDGLGIGDALGVYRNQFDYLVEVADAATVTGLDPSHADLRALPARGVIVTAPDDRDEVDFVSRFFAPGSGVDEDPVTGSAHCALGPFWGARFGRTQLTGYQASRRGGFVRVRVEGDRVVLAGHAVTVVRGELLA